MIENIWSSVVNAFRVVINWVNILCNAIFESPYGTNPPAYVGVLKPLLTALAIPIAILIFIKALSYIRSYGRF